MSEILVAAFFVLLDTMSRSGEKNFEYITYNVDFAVKKDKTTDPPKYVVFFKGRDADAVAQAFKEFVYGNEKRKGRTSVREKLKRFRDAVSQNKNRERSREKNKDRGQSP